MKHITAQDLEGFRKSQRLAYASAIAIRAELKEGWTEKQAAKLMDTYLRDFGVKAFFHKSFAWFGDRSRFQDFSNQLRFLPSDRRLQGDEVVILDTAPILEGYTSDIGYTFSIAPNPELERAQSLLRKFRQDIPALFESNLTTQEIWNQIDLDIKVAGFDNCHQLYPLSALGHRVRKIPLSQFPSVTIPFGVHAIVSILAHGLTSEVLGPKKALKKPGLWAIEPHLGGRGFGAKFEEILVVTENGKAMWLDDHVPHRVVSREDSK